MAAFLFMFNCVSRTDGGSGGGGRSGAFICDFRPASFFVCLFFPPPCLGVSDEIPMIVLFLGFRTPDSE